MKKHFLCLVLFIGCMVYAKPPGLPNVGNTCFMNALLQNLYNLVPITHNLTTNKANAGDSRFLMGYIKVLEAMKNPLEDLSAVLKDFAISGCLRIKKKFKEQQDASEIYQVLVDDLKPKFKIIEDKLYFEEGFTKKCPGAAEEPSGPKEEVNSVMVPMVDDSGESKGGSLNVLLEKYFASGPVKIEGRDCTRQARLFTTPDYLVISLKRFAKDLSGKFTRVNNVVQIPLQLDMRSFVKTTEEAQEAVNGYELIGVVRQAGSLTGGHYTAYIKDQYEDSPAWYDCNDSSISAVDIAIAQGEIDKNGYMLFYKRMKAEDAGPFFKEQDLKRALNDLAQALASL